MNTPLKDDAAPPAGGASVNGENRSSESTLPRPHFAPAVHHKARLATSCVEADRIAGHARTLRAAVLGFIIGQGTNGATDDEGMAALGIKPQIYTPQRGELVALGLVVDSGRRRNTSSGRPLSVWVAATLATTV